MSKSKKQRNFFSNKGADFMYKNNDLESKLLGENKLNYYEQDLQAKIEKEIADAKEQQEKEANKNTVVITDLNKISTDKRFDKQSIYKIFNRKQKTETFVNGEQAENMLKYIEDYVVRFDHRTENL